MTASNPFSGFNLLTTTINGERVAVFTPVIPDDAPEEIREGLARRAIVNAGGTCPCGAVMRFPTRAERRRAPKRPGCVPAAVARHEDDCPAVDEALIEAARRWLG